MSPFLRSFLALFALALLLSSCRSRRPVFDSPYPEAGVVLTQGTLAELDAVLRQRTPPHGVFWASGRVSIRQPEVRGSVWFDATFIYDEPESFRLRGSRMVIGTLFEVIVCGEDAWVHLNKERELYAGTLSELRRQGGMLGAFSLQDMAAAILVHQDLRRRLAEGGSWQVLRTGDELFLTTMLAEGRRVTYRIRRADALVREAIVRGPDGRIELQALYEGFRLSDDGEPLPTRMMLHILGDALSVRFRSDAYKPHSDVKPENVCYLPRNARVFPLAALMDRDAPIAPEEEPE
ncbi:MAG: hypothetical protein KF858_09340 [Candidatus Sumerlaeia bacterium]|nr:hypothetical protein [Candidatus Sumerlaeia bacterium]